MNNNFRERIGWFQGKWANINQLSIAINDRGLSLGDGIFETVLILQGKVQLLSSHINRWTLNATSLHMSSPPTEEWLKPGQITVSFTVS